MNEAQRVLLEVQAEADLFELVVDPTRRGPTHPTTFPGQFVQFHGRNVMLFTESVGTCALTLSITQEPPLDLLRRSAAQPSTHAIMVGSTDSRDDPARLYAPDRDADEPPLLRELELTGHLGFAYSMPGAWDDPFEQLLCVWCSPHDLPLALVYADDEFAEYSQRAAGSQPRVGRRRPDVPVGPLDLDLTGLTREPWT